MRVLSGIGSNGLRRAGRPLAFALAASVVFGSSAALAAPPTIVLIGGKKQGFPVGEHDFPDGVLKLERLIKASPDFARLNPVVKTYPAGFPRNLAEIDDASVVVLYLGTVYDPAGNKNPVLEPAAFQEMQKLMAKGVGFVALHQAFTVADAKSGAPLQDWAGAIRIGSDRSTETAPVTIAAKGHPVTNGVTAFQHHDEYYPNLSFGAGVTPVLTAKAHVQYHGGKPVFEEPSKDEPLAWARERPGGGRSFGFAGAHYLAALDQPQVRKVLLNAILWAAREEVPAAGASSTIPTRGNDERVPVMQERRVLLPISEVKPETQPWGRLEWYVSRSLGNSTTMTVGQATIVPGQQNPVHWHPNCDEVLRVVQGRIMNRVGDKVFEMGPGDTVVIPEGVLHNAHNIGDEDAILAISYNSADRVAIGE